MHQDSNRFLQDCASLKSYNLKGGEEDRLSANKGQRKQDEGIAADLQ